MHACRRKKNIGIRTNTHRVNFYSDLKLSLRGEVRLIDEDIKNQILTRLPKFLKKMKKKKLFAEPRPRWFRLAKLEHDGVHYAVSILVGKDEKETWQMIDELMEWHKKYVADQKDVLRMEDYTVETF